MKKQPAFYFDANACSGCKTCQVACKDKHDLDAGVHWRRVYEITGGEWEKQDGLWVSGIYAYNLSMSCNHCEEPICMFVCPTRAIVKRDDGIVLIDQNKCMGCHLCAWACPYDAPQFDSNSGRMNKCHFCYDYLDRGKRPVCVDSCPMRALDFGDYQELKDRYGDQGSIFPLPDPGITRPKFVINPHHQHEMTGRYDPEVTNMEEVKNG